MHGFCVMGSSRLLRDYLLSFFFFNDTATTEIYTLSLHDALPICRRPNAPLPPREGLVVVQQRPLLQLRTDRKSTRLNSSHDQISYAVFCLKKKKRNCVPRIEPRVAPQHRDRPRSTRFCAMAVRGT